MNKKLFRSAAMVGLTGAISLSSIGAVFAQSPSANSKTKHGVFGSVMAKGEHSFELKTRSGETISFNVTDSTKFRIPGDTDPSFGDITVGSNLAVLAERSESGALALHVLMIPNEVRREHRVLRVLEITGNTIIAEDADGHKVEVKLDHQVSADVKGMLVTFIGERSEASDRFKANAEMKIEQVIKRLEKISSKLNTEARSEANKESREEKQKGAEDINARLKANMESHIAFFEKLIARAPDAAKPGLQEALDKTIAGYRAELEAIDKLGDQVSDAKKMNTASGTVTEVSAAGEIKIKVKDETVTVKTNADTKFQVNGKDGTTADVKIGSNVMARYSSDGLALQVVIRNENSEKPKRVVERQADASGTITAITTVNGYVSNSYVSIKLMTNGETLTLRMDGKTKIALVSGAAATIKVGDNVKIIYDMKTMTAIEIQILPN